MMKHLKIMIELGLIFLLFVSAGVLAASDDTHTVSVTITQTSSSEEGGDTATNTYNEEIDTNESTDVQVTGVISGNEASVITNMDDMTTNKDDTTTTESADPVGMPEFQIGESPDKFTDELSLWISSMVDDVDLLVNINDFPDVADLVNVR